MRLEKQARADASRRTHVLAAERSGRARKDCSGEQLNYGKKETDCSGEDRSVTWLGQRRCHVPHARRGHISSHGTQQMDQPSCTRLLPQLPALLPGRALSSVPHPALRCDVRLCLKSQSSYRSGLVKASNCHSAVSSGWGSPPDRQHIASSSLG